MRTQIIVKSLLVFKIPINRFRAGGGRIPYFHILKSSVADPGCLSRIPDPDFYPSRIPDLGSRIPDPKTATKERGEKKLVVIPSGVYILENTPPPGGGGINMA